MSNKEADRVVFYTTDEQFRLFRLLGSLFKNEESMLAEAKRILSTGENVEKDKKLRIEQKVALLFRQVKETVDKILSNVEEAYEGYSSKIVSHSLDLASLQITESELPQVIRLLQQLFTAASELTFETTLSDVDQIDKRSKMNILTIDSTKSNPQISLVLVWTKIAAYQGFHINFIIGDTLSHSFQQRKENEIEIQKKDLGKQISNILEVGWKLEDWEKNIVAAETWHQNPDDFVSVNRTSLETSNLSKQTIKELLEATLKNIDSGFSVSNGWYSFTLPESGQVVKCCINEQADHSYELWLSLPQTYFLNKVTKIRETVQRVVQQVVQESNDEVGKIKGISEIVTWYAELARKRLTVEDAERFGLQEKSSSNKLKPMVEAYLRELIASSLRGDQEKQ